MRGIDVHQDKGNPDWQRVFAAGIRFAWLKVSEGAGGVAEPGEPHVVPAQRAGCESGRDQDLAATTT